MFKFCLPNQSQKQSKWPRRNNDSGEPGGVVHQRGPGANATRLTDVDSISVFTWAMTLAVAFCLGCDPGVRTPSGASPSTTAVKDTTNDVPPGPQTEPELTEPKADGDATVQVKHSIKSVDQAGLKEAIASYKGKVVLVDFWATWCGPCRKKFPHTVELFNAHQSEGLAVIAVAMDDEDARGDIEEFLTEHHATFDSVRSFDGASDEAFKAFEIPGESLPCLRLYARDGKVLRTFAIDPEADKQFTDDDVATAVIEALKK